MEDIDKVSNLQEFFYTQVRGALRNQRIEALPEIEVYLVQLLSRFAKAEKIYRSSEQGLEEEALCSLLERALESDRESQIILFQRLGDISLYFAGYFPDSLSRKLVDLNYYVQMGGTAYGSLSGLTRKAPVQELYTELAQKFRSWVDVLSEVSAQGHAHNESDLLKIYDTWARTGSRFALSLLQKKGLLPQSESEETH